jgi:hypothetical protein
MIDNLIEVGRGYGKEIIDIYILAAIGLICPVA